MTSSGMTKPHISFVESRLRDVIRGAQQRVAVLRGLGGRRRASAKSSYPAGISPPRASAAILRSRRSKRASERSADGSFSLASVGGDSFSPEHSPLGAPPPPVQATDSWRSTNSSLGRRGEQTATGRAPGARFRRAGNARPGGPRRSLRELTAYNLIESNTSLGTRPRNPSRTPRTFGVAGIDDD